MPVTIAYMGAEGSWSEMAAAEVRDRLFDCVNAPVLLVPAVDHHGVEETLLAGDADYGVLAVHNSLTGRIDAPSATAGRLLGSGFKDVARVTLDIGHDVVPATGTSIREAVAVAGHCEALRQCRGWLDENMPGARDMAVRDAVWWLSAGEPEPGTVAIVPSCGVPGTPRLASGIGPAGNRTEFMVVRRTRSGATITALGSPAGTPRWQRG